MPDARPRRSLGLLLQLAHERPNLAGGDAVMRRIVIVGLVGVVAGHRVTRWAMREALRRMDAHLVHYCNGKWTCERHDNCLVAEHLDAHDELLRRIATPGDGTDVRPVLPDDRVNEPHPFLPRQTTDRYCLLFTGLNTVCGQEEDHPVHWVDRVVPFSPGNES